MPSAAARRRLPGAASSPSADEAAAAADVANVAWVISADPEDVTSSAWDSAEALGEVFGGSESVMPQNTNQSGAGTRGAELAALGVLRRSVSSSTRATAARSSRCASVAHARGAVVGDGGSGFHPGAASAFAAEVERRRGAGDAGARATALDASAGGGTLLAVKPEALLAAVPRLAARQPRTGRAQDAAEGLGGRSPREEGAHRGERTRRERASKPKPSAPRRQ